MDAQGRLLVSARQEDVVCDQRKKCLPFPVIAGILAAMAEKTSPTQISPARVYGSRWVETEEEDGTVSVEEVPLTWDDLFDPQEGDRLMHSRTHGRTLRNIGATLDCLYATRGREDVLVLDDVRIDWKTPGVAPACPDIAVIFGMKKLKSGQREPTSFSEKKEGVSPVFVLEVTSRKTATYDRESKPEIYQQAQVSEIFLLDELKTPWELSGKRRNSETRRYRIVRPDKQGRLLSEMLNVYFSISASGDELVMEDAETGEILRKPVEESQARRTAERQAAEEAEARQEEAEARRAAERQAAEEAEARQKEAEARQEEAEARRAAERQAAEEAEARQKETEARRAAERQAAEEAEARQAAEERVEQGLRQTVKDLCTILGLAWDDEKSTQVDHMNASQLETLRAHVVQDKSWPEAA